MNSKRNDNDDDELEMMFPQDEVYITTEKSESRCFNIYLDKQIYEPSYYRKAFEVLENASEGDLVRIIIDTPGGHLSTAKRFINLIRNCRAEVIGVLSGDALSAGSAILLACPMIQVLPLSNMMIHSASYGTIGMSEHIFNNVSFQNKELARFMDDVYSDFLTAEEVEDIKKSRREIWLNDGEIGERLEKMYQVKSERALKQQESLDEDPPVVFPPLDNQIVEEKPKRKAKVKKSVL